MTYLTFFCLHSSFFLFLWQFGHDRFDFSLIIIHYFGRDLWVMDSMSGEYDQRRDRGDQGDSPRDHRRRSYAVDAA